MSARPYVRRPPSEPRCIAEVAPKQACWKVLPFGGRSHLCEEHAAQVGVVVATHLAGYNRSVRAWRLRHLAGDTDVPWE